MAKRKKQDGSLDYALYARPPIVTIASGIALANALVAGVPKGAADGVRTAKKALAKIAKDAQANWALQQKESRQPKSADGGQAVDAAADGAWTALRDRLDAWSRLPVSADRTRAIDLEVTLFGADHAVGFVQATWPAQLEHMRLLVKRIADESLEADLRKLAGDAFVDAVLAVMTPYEAIVAARSGSNGDGDASPDLLESVRALQGGITVFGVQVLATVVPGSDGSLKAARAMLNPIDVHRERVAKAGVVAPPDPPAPAPPAS